MSFGQAAFGQQPQNAGLSFAAQSPPFGTPGAAATSAGFSAAFAAPAAPPAFGFPAASTATAGLAVGGVGGGGAVGSGILNHKIAVTQEAMDCLDTTIRTVAVSFRAIFRCWFIFDSRALLVQTS